MELLDLLVMLLFGGGAAFAAFKLRDVNSSIVAPPPKPDFSPDEEVEGIVNAYSVAEAEVLGLADPTVGARDDAIIWD